MPAFSKIFTEHPKSVGESYLAHMAMSFSFGFRMFFASFGCILHGLFPFLCVKTGSQAVTKLHHKMVTHRDKRIPVESSSNAQENMAQQSK